MKQQTIDFLNKIFAPRVTKTYTYNGRVANDKQQKEMEKAFEVLEKI